MRGISPTDMVEALERNGGSEAVDCAAHLRAGASLEFFDSDGSSQDGKTLERIYRRRALHCQKTNLDARGLEVAAERFGSTVEVDAAGQVKTEHRLYQFFLGADSSVVACVSVPT